MASYEQPVDKQSYSFQPYQLPYNQIAQTVQAKTQYWLQGANQLKQTQEQAAGLDLSLDQNRQQLRSFTDQTNKQINEAAKSDLSIGDNVQSAMHMYDPLYNGETQMSQQIMGDHAVTTRAKQIQAQFEQSKTKNNGKEYSPVNEQYALKSYQDFVKNGDPTKWRDAYDGIKGYTPYYDYHKEINDNLKNCRPSSMTTTGVNGMYIQSQTVSGLTSSQVSGCVGSNLSPQAENQMAIEGSVKYGNNYQALADDYLPIANGNRTYLATQRATLAAKILDPALNPQQKQGIKNQLDSFDSQIGNIDDSIKRYHEGDLSFFKNNYDTLSAAAYRGQKLQSIGDAFAYSDQNNKISADPVQMMYARFKEDQGLLGQRERFEQGLNASNHTWEDQKQQKLFQHEEYMETLKKNNAQGTITPVTPTVNPDNSPQVTRQSFEQEKQKTQISIDDNEKLLYQHLSTSPYTKDILSGNPTSNPQVYAASRAAILGSPYILQQDPWLKQWKQNSDRLNLQQNAQKSVDESVQSDPAAVAARNSIATVVSNIKDPINTIITGADDHSHLPIRLSPSDVQSLIVKGSTANGITLTTRKEYFGGAGGAAAPTDVDILRINGKDYDVPEQLRQILVQKTKGMGNYDDVLNNLYRKRIVSNPTWGDLSSYNGLDANQVRNTLRSGLQGLVSIPEDKDVKLVSTSYDGRIRFTIPANNKGHFPDAGDLSKAAGNMGLSDIREVPGTPGMYEATGFKQFNRTPDLEFAQGIRTMAESLQQTAANNGNKLSRTPLFTDYHGFGLAAIPGPNGGVIYELSDKDDPSKMVYINDINELTSKMQQIAQFSER